MKIGDQVSWKSQAGGSWKVKTGVIVSVVPLGTDAHQVAIPPGTRLDGPGMCRDHESYLVRVGKKTTLYWPRVAGLSMAWAVPETVTWTDDHGVFVAKVGVMVMSFQWLAHSGCYQCSVNGELLAEHPAELSVAREACLSAARSMVAGTARLLGLKVE